MTDLELLDIKNLKETRLITSIMQIMKYNHPSVGFQIVDRPKTQKQQYRIYRLVDNYRIYFGEQNEIDWIVEEIQEQKIRVFLV